MLLPDGHCQRGVSAVLATMGKIISSPFTVDDLVGFCPRPQANQGRKHKSDRDSTFPFINGTKNHHPHLQKLPPPREDGMHVTGSTTQMNTPWCGSL